MELTEQLTASRLQQSDFIKNLVDNLFQVLNQKEKDVVSKRFAINTEKETLEQIGNKYEITRERVRQIEKSALTKLTRVAFNTTFEELIRISDQAIKDESYFASEEKIVQKIIEHTSTLFIDNPSIIVLCLAINPNLQLLKKSQLNKKSWYNKHKITKVKVSKIFKKAEKILKENQELIKPEDLINELYNFTKAEKININKSTITNLLDANTNIKLVKEGYGLSSWRSVNPKSIKDKAIIVLSRQQKPLHFRTISNLIHQNDLNTKKVTIQAVHNELIRYDDFVLVGRGIYALKKWGYTNGTVKDIIAKVLRENGPLKKSQIVKEVLKQRQVKVGTISLNLQKYPEFKRVGRAVYSI